MLQSSSSCGKDGVSDRGSNSDNASLSCASGGKVLAIDEYNVNLRCVAETWNAVFREAWVFDSAVRKEDSFEERSANALNEGALHLVTESVGVDDGAAFPSLHGTLDLHAIR